MNIEKKEELHSASLTSSLMQLNNIPKSDLLKSSDGSSNHERKRALITGITGQDGSYLTELLLSLGYEVHGIIRRSSSFNTGRIEHLYKDPHEKTRLHLHYGDLTDATALISVLHASQPHEVYNLGAQSHVKYLLKWPNIQLMWMQLELYVF